MIREPKRKYALVRGTKSQRVYMRTSPDVMNGWHEVTNGFGTDLTWGELKFWEPEGVEVVFAGPARGTVRPEGEQ